MANLIPGLDYADGGNSLYRFVNNTGSAQTVLITYSTQTAASWVSALGELGLSLAPGYIGQGAWAWLQGYNAAQAVQYSGMGYVYADAYPLTNQAEVENHSFEVLTGHNIPGGQDVWPDVVLRDFLVTNQSSVGWSAARLASLGQFNSYVRARQLWLSVQMAEQKPARDWLQGLAEICNAEWTWQGGLLDLVPRGDEAISSGYGAFTPNTTPVFDLVHGEGGDLLTPVEVEPVVNEDAHNVIKIEWTNRNNNYAIEVMTASDQAHIELFGQRPASVVAMHAIHDANVATSVAQQLLQREMTVWNKYRFAAPFSRALIGLMDLCTLTDADSNLDRVPVRITSRSESGTMEYTYEAEDAPIGSASAPVYGAQAGTGFQHNYNAPPGNALDPVIFEAPADVTLNGLEVYSAVTGPANGSWGGCRVHVSLDGLQYQDRGRIYGGARYGQLTAAMATTGNAVVQLAGQGGQMLSGSASDAQALTTLCWADGVDGGEYFAYQTATLTAANAYTLGGLVRAAYQNTLQAHTTGAKFVRVDASIGKSGQLSDALVGRTIYFKFCSFNVYGGGEQGLADVAAYPYTITGKQLMLPPPGVANFAVVLQADGYRATWSALANPADYKFTKIKKGTDWATAAEAGPGGAGINDATTGFALGWLPAGTTAYLSKHQDRYGAQSQVAAPTSVTVLPPAAPVMLKTNVEANKLDLQWQDAKTSQPIRGYFYEAARILLGVEQARLPWGSSGADSRSDNRPFTEAGDYRFYIYAVDVAGNVGASTSFPINIKLPNDFQSLLVTNSLFAGPLVNASKTGPNKRVRMLVNPTETWGQHFSSRSWANIQAQINAGFPLFGQPGTATASYSETNDIGKVFAVATVNVTLIANVLAGTPTALVTISWSADNTTWVSASPGVVSTAVTNIRYVRVTVNAASSDSKGLLELASLQTAVQVQRVTENTGVLNISAADVSGTMYTTTAPFSDVTDCQMTEAETSTPVMVKTSYVTNDAGAPTTPARVYFFAFDAAGNRVSGKINANIIGV